jgi:hypothetical protein
LKQLVYLRVNNTLLKASSGGNANKGDNGSSESHFEGLIWFCFWLNEGRCMVQSKEVWFKVRCKRKDQKVGMDR